MSQHAHSNQRFSVYQSITDKIIAAIKAGAQDFVMPWHRGGPARGRPANAQSRMRYRGVNVVALWAEATMSGYRSGWWATFEQWKGLGGHVRRGEHGTVAVFYKPLQKPNADNDDDEADGARLVARAFTVFNADQVDGWNPPEPPGLGRAEILEQAELFAASTGAEIRIGGDMACYRPGDDVIDMPERRLFVGSASSSATEAYYSTLLHELVHWTGAEHRLKRDLRGRFGDEAYAMEELIAEIGAAFLCADLELSNEPRPDHAAYVAHWLKVLKDDPRAIFLAASRSRDAAAYLGAFPGSPTRG